VREKEIYRTEFEFAPNIILVLGFAPLGLATPASGKTSARAR
jgi:hypothetical protein